MGIVAKYKARLRAWMIDLVREAIRIERFAEAGARSPITEELEELRYWKDNPEKARIKSYLAAYPGRFSTPKIKEERPIQVDASFEQLQEEALKAQEKYYEPERA